jgi:hypothetical protein
MGWPLLASQSRNRNVPVQDFYLGLDFSAIPMRARLAQGSYLAVQISEALQMLYEPQTRCTRRYEGFFRSINVPEPGVDQNASSFSYAETEMSSFSEVACSIASIF